MTLWFSFVSLHVMFFLLLLWLSYMSCERVQETCDSALHHNLLLASPHNLISGLLWSFVSLLNGLRVLWYFSNPTIFFLFSRVSMASIFQDRYIRFQLLFVFFYTGLYRYWWVDCRSSQAPLHHYWFTTYNLLLACAPITYILKYLLTTPTFTHPLGSHVIKENLVLAPLSCRTPLRTKQRLLQRDIEEPIALKAPLPSFSYAGWT